MARPDFSKWTGEEEAEVAVSPIKLLKRYFIAIVLIAWVFLTQRTILLTFNAFWFYTGAIIIGIYMLETAWITWKHKSPKLITNPIFTSTIGYGWRAGDYDIFTIGDINWGLQIRGREGTVIVPSVSITPLGRCLISTVRLQPAKKEELPEEVQTELDAMPCFRPPWFFGMADEAQYGSDMKLTDEEAIKFCGGLNIVPVSLLIKQIKETNKYATYVKALWSDKTELIEKAVSSAGRIREKIDTGMVAKMKRWVEGEEER